MNQLRGFLQNQIRFFPQFFRSRILQSFAPFDTSAGEKPPFHISMANQQDMTVIVLDNATHTERHGTPGKRIYCKQPRTYETGQKVQ